MKNRLAKIDRLELIKKLESTKISRIHVQCIKNYDFHIRKTQTEKIRKKMKKYARAMLGHHCHHHVVVIVNVITMAVVISKPTPEN